MREIILAWTRDFTLPWAEWWSRDMNPRLIEVFGTGVPNQLSYYNGRLLETYRPADEARGFIEAVVNADLSKLGQDKIDRYVSLNKEIRKLINAANKKQNFADKLVFERLKTITAEMYPWYTVSYLLPQDQWAAKLIEKYPKEAKDILNRLVDARKQSEGTIEELVEYWRSVAKVLLAQRKLAAQYASFVTFNELEKMLADEKYSPNLKELKARSKSYIFFVDAVYTGISKDDFFAEHGFVYTAPNEKASVQELKGMVSCPGPASIRGKVSIILRNDEVENFKEGDILVTVMTNPFFVPIMKKAKAIITDEGGITCHAAIVSRELNVPCITGTKVATKVLKDGDMVEVDATKGIVKKI